MIATNMTDHEIEMKAAPYFEIRETTAPRGRFVWVLHTAGGHEYVSESFNTMEACVINLMDEGLPIFRKNTTRSRFRRHRNETATRL